MWPNVKTVKLCAYSGNGGDVEAYLEIAESTWKKIQAGETMTKYGNGAYEGSRFRTGWYFSAGHVSIEDLSNQMELNICMDISSLYVS